MKEKCQALRVSIAITATSFLICCLLWAPLPSPFSQYAIAFFQMFFGGVLGSSFVTLLIYTTEYRIQKRITLENVWNEASRINHGFKAIQYIYLPYPKEIVAGYLNEMWHNQVVPLAGMRKNKYGKQWVNALRNEYQDTIGKNISGTEYEEMLKRIRDQKVNEYLDTLIHAIEGYISIAQTDWNELNKLFGVIEFLTGKRQYEKLYQNIYEPLWQKRRVVEAQVYPHFLPYKNGENKNRGVILLKLLELQSQFFTVESDKSGTHIYNDFWTNMERKIEDFRVSIYKRESPDYPERLNVHSVFSLPSTEKDN